MLQWTYSSAFECTAVVAFIQTYEHTMNQNKMHYFFSFLCISVFISFLLSQIPFTAAGRTPSRQYGKLRSASGDWWSDKRSRTRCIENVCMPPLR